MSTRATLRRCSSSSRRQRRQHRARVNPAGLGGASGRRHELHCTGLAHAAVCSAVPNRATPHGVYSFGGSEAEKVQFLEALQTLTQLSCVDRLRCRLTAGSMACVAQLRTLTELELSGSDAEVAPGVADRQLGLGALCSDHLSNLAALRLHDLSTQAAGVVTYTQLSQLRTLTKLVVHGLVLRHVSSSTARSVFVAAGHLTRLRVLCLVDDGGALAAYISQECAEQCAGIANHASLQTLGLHMLRLKQTHV